jgi:hypothetical protein
MSGPDMASEFHLPKMVEGKWDSELLINNSLSQDFYSLLT